MTTTAVIKHFDVFEQVRNRFAMRATPRAVYPLILLEAFGRRFVILYGVSIANWRLSHTICSAIQETC
jgi:hypothetical protein